MVWLRALIASIIIGVITSKLIPLTNIANTHPNAPFALTVASAFATFMIALRVSFKS